MGRTAHPESSVGCHMSLDQRSHSRAKGHVTKRLLCDTRRERRPSDSISDTRSLKPPLLHRTERLHDLWRIGSLSAPHRQQNR